MMDGAVLYDKRFALLWGRDANCENVHSMYQLWWLKPNPASRFST